MYKFKIDDEVLVVKEGLAASGCKGSVMSLDFVLDEYVCVEWYDNNGHNAMPQRRVNWFKASSLEPLKPELKPLKPEGDDQNEEVKVCFLIHGEYIEYHVQDNKIKNGWVYEYDRTVMLVGTEDDINRMISQEMDDTGDSVCYVVIDNKLKEVRKAGLVFEDVD